MRSAASTSQALSPVTGTATSATAACRGESAGMGRRRSFTLGRPSIWNGRVLRLHGRQCTGQQPAGAGNPLAGLNHLQSYDRTRNRHANGRFQSTAAVGRQPLERGHSPTLSLAVSRHWSAPDAAVRPQLDRQTRLCRPRVGIHPADFAQRQESTSRGTEPARLLPAQVALSCCSKVGTSSLTVGWMCTALEMTVYG